MAEERILEVEGLTGGYGRTTVLNDMTFGVRPGRITTIIGPNGAGKSTAFKAIFGLLPLRSGRVRLDGVETTGTPPRALLARGVAYLPQGRNVFPELSVRHNLELGGWAGDAAALEARVDEALARFPVLANRADAQASTLSGGEQKILEVARALLLRPRLLLVDEPSIGLSPIMMRGLFDLLSELRAEGVTIVMVEQNARRALAASDDGIVLEQGRTLLEAPAAEILARDDLGALFLGGAASGGSDLRPN